MSAEHRKPVMAFVMLAFVAAALVGIQRADAQGGRLVAAVIGSTVSVHGILPTTSSEPAEVAAEAEELGPVFAALRAKEQVPSRLEQVADGPTGAAAASLKVQHAVTAAAASTQSRPASVAAPRPVTPAVSKQPAAPSRTSKSAARAATRGAHAAQRSQGRAEREAVKAKQRVERAAARAAKAAGKGSRAVRGAAESRRQVDRDRSVRSRNEHARTGRGHSARNESGHGWGRSGGNHGRSSRGWKR